MDNSRKNLAKKIGEIKSVIASFFRSVSRFSLATPYFEQLFTFKPKIFAQNPLCQKLPLSICSEFATRSVIHY